MKRTAALLFAYIAIFTTFSQAADVRQGLVSYWPLDTVDLNTFTTPDVVAGNNLLLYNINDQSSLVSGKFNKALAFDASLQQLAYFTGDTNIDLGLPITANASYTISFWVNATGTGQSDLRYFCESAVVTANNNPLYALGTQSAGANASTRIYLRNGTGGVLVDNTPTNAVLDGVWRHVAAVYDAGIFTLYVDGEKAFSGPYTADTANVWDTTAIGGIVRASIDHFFTGSMDDVALWARPLSQDEVKSVMTNGIQTPVPQFLPAFSVNPNSNTNLLAGDTVTLKAGAYGTRPMSYQWTKDGVNIPGATSFTLTLTNITLAASGNYALTASNSQGATTSAAAKLTVRNFDAPDITKGLIAYWPLDSVVGTKTPDLVSGYDMTMVNMTATNLVDGKWKKAMKFDNASHTLLQRVDNPGEDLPIYNKSEFSISMWLNGDSFQTDRRVWSEGSTANNNPLFNLGTAHNGADGTIDSYIRTDTGATADHKYSTAPVFDNTWHSVVYTQRQNAGTPVASLYVDGQLDPIVLSPMTPLTLNTTTIGGILRSSASSWFSGLIDEVAVWNRALSPEEIQILQTTSITNPPSRLQPLAINSFKADLPAVASGGSTVLRWDVSKDAGQVNISTVGDVTAATVVGIGATNITLASTTSYVLTVTRGVDSISATTSVAVVTGVAPGWALVDNFDTYSPGPINATKWWLDLRGNSVQVVPAANGSAGNGLATPAADSDATLELNSLTVKEGQSSTLFFRMTLPAVPDTATPLNLAGLTDKNARGLSDLVATTGDSVSGGLGPVVYPSVIVDPNSGTNAWYLGARNGVGGLMDYSAGPLEPGATYNVWLEVTNTPLMPDFLPDIFSVYLQKEGDTTRTKAYDSYQSDRDPFFEDVILGGIQPNLDKLVVAGDSATTTVTFDDFYLANGSISTVPVAINHNTGPLPAVNIAWSGAQLQITWAAGSLQSATSVNGPWQNVGGASSPFTVTPTTGQVFYRASQ